MKEDEILKYERIIKEKEKSESQGRKIFADRITDLDRLSRVASVMQKPKGIIWKRCPKCNNPLKEKITWVNGCECFKSFKCECGYEYAMFCSYTNYGLE